MSVSDPEDTDEIYVPPDDVPVVALDEEPVPTELKEMHFELLPSEDAANGFAFGIGLEVSVNEDGFDPGSMDWSTQDSDDQTRGLTRFGRDVLAGPTWTWALHTNRADTVGALESLNRIATAWRGQAVVDTPGALMPLRYRVGDRVRRVYGRARRFSHSPTNLILSGKLAITADFKTVDSFTYSDQPSVVSLSPKVAAPSGLIFPLTFPTQITQNDTDGIPAFVYGDAPAYPVITIRGPITNPYIATSRWTMQIKTALTVDDTLVIDLRPWKQTATKNGNQSLAASLDRRLWLEDCYLVPGAGEHFTFGGVGNTSGANATIAWRATYNSL